jgi:5-formyltetrahydrofolate cyclo-ligase
MARIAGRSEAEAHPAMSNVVLNKSALRRQLRERVQALSAQERAQASAQICQRLAEQVSWRAAQSILFYAPTVTEPDIQPLLTEALAQGKSVALPRFNPATDSYMPCLIRETSDDLVTGEFGIAEPGAHCSIIELKQLDLALVPGLGFTLSGCRLGRGKGYYDRLLAALSGFKCGVAFDCQVIQELPLESHDVRVNCILTPTRWHPVPAAVLK